MMVCTSSALIVFSLGLARVVLAGIPSQIYGVNLGSWLLAEPWMFPREWREMGGESCSDCGECIASEFAYAKAYPDTVDAAFNRHWETWFTQADVDRLVQNGINTVRIPLGFWIIEDLVDRSTEYYARGGLRQLRRGLIQLRDAGIAVILDHHALPGAQSVNQMFAGVCTPTPQFYTPYNYHRALVWAAVMTAITHTDPAYSGVFAIQAANEPEINADNTPGYGDYQKNFVQVVRAVELVLGIPSPDLQARSSAPNATAALSSLASSNLLNLFNPQVRSVIKDAVPILARITINLAIPGRFGVNWGVKQDLIVTNFMDAHWQYNNPPNPADAAIGPQTYDSHLYFAYGGVADANEDSYLKAICNLRRIKRSATLGNTPLWFGEWSLATNFNASDEFLGRWADAQKRAYSKSHGWIFWNFKTEPNFGDGTPMSRYWSYFEGLDKGYLTQDPSELQDKQVCDPYLECD